MEHNYHSLLNTIDAIIWEADAKTFQFSFVSMYAELLLGYPAQQWVDEPDFFRDHIHPEDKDDTIACLVKCISERRSNRMDYRMVAKDGQVVWIHNICSVIAENSEPVYLRGVMTDITELKLQQLLTEESQRLEAETEHRWKTIFNRANDAILLTNAVGRFTQVNPAAADILGYSPDELLQLSLQDIFAQFTPDGQDHEALWADFKKAGNQTGIVELKRKGGTVITCQYNGVKNILPGLNLLIFTDITQHEERRKEIIALNNTLQRKVEELATSNDELERFAYVTSHDLQEPLRMVSSFLQLLQKKYDSQLDETANKYINFAVDGASRMKVLILDLLEYSRISSVKEEHSIIDLNTVIAKTTQTLKAVIEESGASIRISSLPNVCGNTLQLLQLFQNLIGNALKYRNGQQPVIEIGYTENDTEWQFFVKDNGIGIEQKYFDKIFVIFQRLHGRQKYDGTGIGLAVCKKIVELHGGRIWVESEFEKGSSFYFTISKAQMNYDAAPKILCADILETL